MARIATVFAFMVLLAVVVEGRGEKFSPLTKLLFKTSNTYYLFVIAFLNNFDIVGIIFNTKCSSNSHTAPYQAENLAALRIVFFSSLNLLCGKRFRLEIQNIEPSETRLQRLRG